MKVIRRTNKGYPQDPTKYFHFERFEKQCGDFFLIEAAFEESDGWEQFDLPVEVLKNIKTSKIVRLEFEEPNKFFLGDRMQYDTDFYKVFTLCKFTADWKNKLMERNFSEPMYFPFNTDYLPTKKLTKIYDVVYSGHLVSKRLLRDIKRAKKLTNTFRLISNQRHRLVTDSKISYERKLEIYSQARVTLVHNILYPTKSQLKRIMDYSDWQENEAFKNVKLYMSKSLIDRAKSELPVVPQLKSRVFEAAFTKSLIFCRKDDFNVIDDYFEEGRDYVSFDDSNFDERLSDILNNYEKYLPLVNNAYEKAMKNYTVESFVNKNLKNL
ncbi:glycosyltransferase [Schleiferiaceae bacterium]|nr:glycosyltransferase [Schleiferiaceae bacterium]